MNSLKKLASVLMLTLLPLSVNGHNYETYLKADSNSNGTNGEICWRYYKDQITFSGSLKKKFLGKNLKKDFCWISKDNLFIINKDTLYVDRDCSNLLRVIENELEAIKDGLKNRNSKYKIVVQDGGKQREIEIETRYREDTKKLIIKPIKCSYLVKDWAKELAINVGYSTEGHYMLMGCKIDDTKLCFDGYTPLNEKGEPVIKFNKTEK